MQSDNNRTHSRPDDPSPPHLPNVGVIALTPNRWNEYWESRHHILSRLSKYFNVVWVNPAPEWREMQLWKAPRNEGWNSNLTAMAGFAVYEPDKWLPKMYRPKFLASFTERMRLQRARRLLYDRGSRSIILYLWRPGFRTALDLIQHDVSCYHIDDEYTFSKAEKPLQERERMLISRVDQVFIHSPALMEKKGHLNSNTTFVPNGVDYLTYATSYDEPVDLRSIPHPRIGYIGKIKKHLDFPLLHELALRHKSWSFVFVGPSMSYGEHAPVVRKFSQLPNVNFLGARPFHTLPAYTQHLDVCMLCYELNGYTKFIYPLKLHEYLACGRPVVSTPIRTVQEFAHVIRIARTPDEWSQAIADLLTPAACSISQIEVRRRVARQHDWNILVHKIGCSLCERLGPTFLSALRDMHSKNHSFGETCNP